MGEDQFFPGQLIQEAGGAFNIDISGHVHAQGLDLDAGTTLTPPDTDRIRWLRLSDGSVVADIYGKQTADLSEVDINSYVDATDPNRSSVISLKAQNANSGANSDLNLVAGSPATGTPNTATLQAGGIGTSYLEIMASLAQSHIRANSNGNSVDVIDQNGNSGFIQLQPTAQPRIQRMGLPARAFRNAALVIAATGSQSMLADTVSYDPGSALTAAPRKFTCPAAGKYLVTMAVQITTSATSFFAAQIWRNGALSSQGEQLVTNGGAGSAYAATASDIIDCAQNDTLEGGFTVGAVSTTSLQAGSSARNHFTVIQLA